MKSISFAIAKGLEDAFDVMTHSPNPQESRFDDRGRSIVLSSKRCDHKMVYTLKITESTPYEVWQALELRDVDGATIAYGEDFAPKYLLVTSDSVEISFDIVTTRNEKPPRRDPPQRPHTPHKPQHKPQHRPQCKPCPPEHEAKPFPFPMTPVPVETPEEDEEVDKGFQVLY